RLSAAVAGGRSADQLDGAIPVVAVDHVGPGSGRDGGKRAQRDHVASAGADVEAVDVARLGAEFRLGLNHHLPGAAEYVEVVHIEPAEECLQGTVGVGGGDAEGLDLVEVDIHFVGRDIGAEGIDHVTHLGANACSLGRQVGDVGQFLHAHAEAIFEHELKSSGGAQSLNGRLAEGVGAGFRQARQCPLQVGDNGSKLLVGGGTVVPRFQTGDHGGDIRAGGAGGDIRAAQSKGARYARDLADDRLHPGGCRAGALRGRCVGQADGNVDGALIFVGKKAGGKLVEQPAGREPEAEQPQHRQRRFADEGAHAYQITAAGPLEYAVEPVKETPHRAACLHF